MNNKSFEYLNYEVLDIIEIAPEIVTIKLRGKLDFRPGQFVQASLSNYGEGTFAPCNKIGDKDSFEICVKGSGNLSRKMIELLPGDCLKVRGPYGNDWPIGRAIDKNILIITGGMGIVPLRPLLFELLGNREDFKNISFLAGFKSDEHLLFKDDLTLWQKKLSNFCLYMEHGQSELTHEKGFVMSGLKKFEYKKDTIVFICGPEIMYKPCLDVLLEKGILEKNIYLSYERRMECGIGICQHCNIGKYMVCDDGPIFRYDIIKDEIGK